jgi:hypothetical protein
MTDMQKSRILNLRRQGCSFTDIADEVGIPRNTVKTFCRRSQVQVCEAFKDTGKQDYKENKELSTHCKHCEKPIMQIPKQKPRHFCDGDCRSAYWKAHRDQMCRTAFNPVVCAYCGATFDDGGHKSRKYCCHACYIAGRFGKAVAAV